MKAVIWLTTSPIGFCRLRATQSGNKKSIDGNYHYICSINLNNPVKSQYVLVIISEEESD